MFFNFFKGHFLLMEGQDMSMSLGFQVFQVFQDYRHQMKMKMKNQNQNQMKCRYSTRLMNMKSV